MQNSKSQSPQGKLVSKFSFAGQLMNDKKVCTYEILAFLTEQWPCVQSLIQCRSTSIFYLSIAYDFVNCCAFMRFTAHLGITSFNIRSKKQHTINDYSYLYSSLIQFDRILSVLDFIIKKTHK